MGKNVWKKVQGVKNFGNEGEGRFREILSCPPKMRVAPQMPPPKFQDLTPPLPGYSQMFGKCTVNFCGGGQGGGNPGE